MTEPGTRRRAAEPGRGPAGGPGGDLAGQRGGPAGEPGGDSAGIGAAGEFTGLAALVTGGRYLAPETPGASTRIRPQSLAEFSFPAGAAWRATGLLA